MHTVRWLLPTKATWRPSIYTLAFVHLLGLGGDDLCWGKLISTRAVTRAGPSRASSPGGGRGVVEERQARTLNVGDALLQNLLQDLGVLEFLLDLGDDGGGQLLLLALLDLALVAGPGVEDSLGLGGEGRLLLELKGLGLEFGGFLRGRRGQRGAGCDRGGRAAAAAAVPWRPRTGPW